MVFFPYIFQKISSHLFITAYPVEGERRNMPPKRVNRGANGVDFTRLCVCNSGRDSYSPAEISGPHGLDSIYWRPA